MSDVMDPGLDIENEVINCEFVPGEVPPRRPCQSGFIAKEDKVEAEVELLVNVPPRFPKYCHVGVPDTVGSAFEISSTILYRLVAEPKLAIVNPLVTKDRSAALETRSQPTIQEVTGKPSPTEPV